LDMPFAMLVAEALNKRGVAVQATIDTDSLYEEICNWYFNR